MTDRDHNYPKIPPIHSPPAREENHSHALPYDSPMEEIQKRAFDPASSTKPDRPSLISVQGLADLALRSLAECKSDDVASRRHSLIGVIQIARLRMRDRALDEVTQHYHCHPGKHACGGLCDKIRALIPPDMDPRLVDVPTVHMDSRSATANLRLALAKIAVLATRAAQWAEDSPEPVEEVLGVSPGE